jgi:hypothetical protein
MKGLRRRIVADIAEVEHEIKVDLGLEQPTIEEVQATDFVNEEESEEEYPEVVAFGKLLDEITENHDDIPEEKTDEENFEALSEILNKL